MKFASFLSLFVFILLLGSCNNKPKEENVTPDEEESQIIGEQLNYSSDTTQMSGYIAYDSAIEGQRPGVLVVHEWWGHNEYARQRAEKLAELGYVALAVDMYGEGKQAGHPDEAGKFSSMVMSDMDVAKGRFEAAMNELRTHPKVNREKIAAIGYCFGGSVVLSMANAGYDLDAVAAFHSGVQLPVAPSKKLKAIVLVANGADDPFISTESVDDYKTAMDSIGADYKYISYKDAKHSFTNPDADSLAKKFDLPLAYNEMADKNSWDELKELLNRAFEQE